MLVSRNFVDLITFSRASPAWCFNSAGLLVQETDGVPRFDYDPITRQPRGLLIEEERTNLAIRSSEFDNASWAKNNLIATANAAVAPDGSMTADKLVPTATNANHGVTVSSAEVVGDTMYFWSVYVKAGEYNHARLRAADSSGFLGDMIVDLSAGTIFNPSPYAGVQAVGGGWFRLTFGWATSASATGISLGVWVYDNAGGATFTGDGTSGLYVWGAQLEEGTFPTSYIPTTTSAATRAADVARITDLAQIGFNPVEGTFYVEAQVGALGNSSVANQYPHMIGLTKGASLSAGDYLGLRISQPDTMQLNIGNSGAFHSLYPSGGPTSVGTLEKMAAAGAGTSIVAARNGNVAGPLITASWPSDVDTLWIGSQGGTTRFWNGWIRALRYYPRRLSAAELQALTA